MDKDAMHRMMYITLSLSAFLIVGLAIAGVLYMRSSRELMKAVHSLRLIKKRKVLREEHECAEWV